ncbi:hypothetical protein NB640_11060 [Oxalobacter vibrioformis]|uniref:Uncharacterized protein n=1 Tax=Oxalobacter vibrioformis TaxID=933080 RepID=A0A9E9P446_9BURK|nr:hypothetical protein [Oxalobacter vibrioformis]WAW09751.1 hypothetical protein NB640_11060 [Oxalobacter vibrioformis]
MDEERKKHWLRRDAWEGWQAASLLHGYDPTIDALARAAHDGDFKAVFSDTLQLLSDAAAMGKLKEETNRSSFIENLNFILYPNYNKLYYPKEIIKWAADKDFPDFPFTMADVNKKEINSDSIDTGNHKWPWGDYETDLLRRLEQAARNFWTTYDPEDPSTAPTNKQVEDWLKEQGVADRTAEIMATILRADGLRTGPR